MTRVWIVTVDGGTPIDDSVATTLDEGERACNALFVDLQNAMREWS